MYSPTSPAISSLSFGGQVYSLSTPGVRNDVIMQPRTARMIGNVPGTPMMIDSLPCLPRMSQIRGSLTAIDVAIASLSYE